MHANPLPLVPEALAVYGGVLAVPHRAPVRRVDARTALGPCKICAAQMLWVMPDLSIFLGPWFRGHLARYVTIPAISCCTAKKNSD